ncbi:MAG TPA: hypothetical protein VJ901_19660 [Thermoanaerobaculia bacterium]|nr:hypothetical protein [Thermoanaerobaculia bacterium]
MRSAAACRRRIEIRDKQLFLNDAEVVEPYVIHEDSSVYPKMPDLPEPYRSSRWRTLRRDGTKHVGGAMLTECGGHAAAALPGRGHAAVHDGMAVVVQNQRRHGRRTP